MTKDERKEYNERYRKENHYRLVLYTREYIRTHKEERKAYYQKNKEKINAYSKKYYREHKDKWQEIYIPRAIVKGAKND